MAKRKWLSGIISSLMALSVCTSTLILPASAHEDGDTVRLTIKLLSDSLITDSQSDLCYPGRVDRSDITNFTLTAKSGNVYESMSYDSSLSDRNVVFGDVKESDLDSLTLTFNTNTLAIPVSAGLDVEYYAYDVKLNAWTAGGASLDSSMMQKELTGDSLNQMENAHDISSVTPEYTGNYVYPLQVSLNPAGFGSVMLAQMPDGNCVSHPSSGTAYDDRETYGIDNIFNYKVSIGGVEVPAALGQNGIVYFNLPVEWNKDGRYFACKGDLVVDIAAFYNDSQLIYSASFNFGAYDGDLVSANKRVRWLNFDAEAHFSDEDIADAEEDAFDDPIDDTITDGGEEILEGRGGVTYNITSTLGKYDFALLDDSTSTFSLIGAPTKMMLSMYADGDTIPDSVSYGGFDLKTSATATLYLDEGKYSPSYSNLLNVTGASELSIKGTAVKEAAISVSPKFSLEVTGTGDLNYSVDDIGYNTASGYLFALDSDVPHYVKDNTSGKLYEVIATPDNPNIKITLGSDEGVFGNADDTNPDGTAPFEDVPNTADGITLFLLIPIALAIPAICLGIIAFKKNKSLKGGK